jgi:hypothetical protein
MRSGRKKGGQPCLYLYHSRGKIQQYMGVVIFPPQWSCGSMGYCIVNVNIHPFSLFEAPKVTPVEACGEVE